MLRLLSQLSYGPKSAIFQSKKLRKTVFLDIRFLRGKSGKPDEKLEGKIGPVMEVHTDANRTLSQLSYRPISDFPLVNFQRAIQTATAFPARLN